VPFCCHARCWRAATEAGVAIRLSTGAAATAAGDGSIRAVSQRSLTILVQR